MAEITSLRGTVVQFAKRYAGAGLTALFVIGILIQSLSTAQAEKYGYNQADCPAIVKQAIDTIGSECAKTARNKLCYGNSTIQAVFQPGVTNVKFQAPGDTVDVPQIKEFTLGAMDVTASTWGVAEMKIKADLPDTDPTQAVTMILFGAVHLLDGDADANTALLTRTPGAIARQNQYATATTNAINQQVTRTAATATKLAGLESTVTANAQTPTGTRSALQATQGAATATELAAYENTATGVPIPQTPVPGVLSGPYTALQAFYFQSNDTAPCVQAPHDGILIQSPQNTKQRVTLSVDGVTISLGSTVYVTAQPSKFLTINTLEGSAEVTVGAQIQFALPGFAVQVPLDANLHPSGPPTEPQFYTSDAVRALPITPLPTTIIAAPGLPLNAITTHWTFVNPGGAGTCVKFPPTTGTSTISADSAGAYLWFSSQYQLGSILRKGSEVLVRASDGSYQGTHQADVVRLTDGQPFGTTLNDYNYRFTDATHIVGVKTLNVTTFSGKSCTVATPVTFTEVGTTPALPTQAPTELS